MPTSPLSDEVNRGAAASAPKDPELTGTTASEVPAHRYVVASLGAGWDYYQTPLALAECGRLETLVTSFYCPDWVATAASHLPGRVARQVLSRRARNLPWVATSALNLPGRVARQVLSRRARNLPSRLVASPLLAGELRWKLMKTVGVNSQHLQQRLEHRLGEVTADWAMSRGSGALVYSYYWPGFADRAGALRRQRNRGPRILFQVHPLPSQVRPILERDRERTKIPARADIEESISEEESRAWDTSVFEADGVIVNSSFTKSGLTDIGYPADRVRVVPYGGDFAVRLVDRHMLIVADDDSRPTSGHPLRLLYVGQVTYRKGIHHLFEAMRRLEAGTATLTIVCRTTPDPVLMADAPSSVEFVGEVSDADLLDIYGAHDVMVMPSLVEGFGLVYLEAMHMGLPVVCTTNTGAADLITNGVEGVILEPGDVEALSDALDMLAGDPELVAEMATKATVSARNWTWERFRNNLKRAIRDIELGIPRE